MVSVHIVDCGDDDDVDMFPVFPILYCDGDDDEDNNDKFPVFPILYSGDGDNEGDEGDNDVDKFSVLSIINNEGPIGPCPFVPPGGEEVNNEVGVPCRGEGVACRGER